MMSPADVTKEVTASGLLGHGGAAFPVGRKWSVIKLTDGQPHYLCCNADEGEPGTFKDRWILENAPHLLLESMLIACYALGVRHAFVYIRGEFDLPYPPPAGGDRRGLRGRLLRPAGIRQRSRLRCLHLPRRRLVCVRRSVRADHVDRRQEGLSAQPAAAADRQRAVSAADRGQQRRDARECRRIIANGAEAFRKVGTAKSPGTQLVSISGHVNRPGVYEVEHGYPLAKLIFDDCGGMLGGRALKALIPGGISTKVLTGDDCANLAYDHGSFLAAGSQLGSGGMIAVAEGTCMVRLLQVMLRFWHHESCGQCTPCREGMGWMHRILDRIVDGEGPRSRTSSS
jgi:NADH-quinone oxidoreductase subunit F